MTARVALIMAPLLPRIRMGGGGEYGGNMHGGEIKKINYAG